MCALRLHYSDACLLSLLRCFHLLTGFWSVCCVCVRARACVCLCVCVCVCVCVCGGIAIFTRSPGLARMATLASSGRVTPIEAGPLYGLRVRPCVTPRPV